MRRRRCSRRRRRRPHACARARGACGRGACPPPSRPSLSPLLSSVPHMPLCGPGVSFLGGRGGGGEQVIREGRGRGRHAAACEMPAKAWHAPAPHRVTRSDVRTHPPGTARATSACGPYVADLLRPPSYRQGHTYLSCHPPPHLFHPPETLPLLSNRNPALPPATHPPWYRLAPLPPPPRRPPCPTVVVVGSSSAARRSSATSRAPCAWPRACPRPRSAAGMGPTCCSHSPSWPACRPSAATAAPRSPRRRLRPRPRPCFASAPP